MAVEHVRPRAGTKRRANAPCPLRVGEPGIPGLAEPFGGERVLLPRRMERDPGVAVVAGRRRRAACAAFPRRRERRRRRCAPLARARRARVRFRLDLPAKLAHSRAMKRGSHRPARTRGTRSCRSAGMFDGDRLREAHVAGFGREPKARAPVVDGQVALGDQRREERLAGIGRVLAREPERLRVGERRVAVALATVLHAIAGELDVLARRRWVKGREARPLAALPQCLQPVHAQPVRERRFRPASEVVAPPRRRRRVSRLSFFCQNSTYGARMWSASFGASASRRTRSPRSKAARAARKSASLCPKAGDRE